MIVRRFRVLWVYEEEEVVLRMKRKWGKMVHISGKEISRNLEKWNCLEIIMQVSAQFRRSTAENVHTFRQLTAEIMHL